MSDSPGEDHREAPAAEGRELRGVRASVAIAVVSMAVRRLSRAAQRDDPEDAGLVSVSERAWKVAQLASDLAEEGREDDQAVAELVALAQNSKRTLENAERFSRQDAAHTEDEVGDRTNRLLVAAVNGRAVQPASPAAKELFAIVERFDELPSASAWRLLVSREPRLAELEARTRQGVFTTATSSLGRRRQPQFQTIAREQALAASELGDQLRELVGPRAWATDPLLTSRAAFATALSHLTDVDQAAAGLT